MVAQIRWPHQLALPSQAFFAIASQPHILHSGSYAEDHSTFHKRSKCSHTSLALLALLPVLFLYCATCGLTEYGKLSSRSLLL